MLASLGVALWVRQQSSVLDSRVTFACQGTRADVVLQSLAQKSGTVLRAVGDVAQDVLVIRVRDVPLGDLMARIADAASARWVRRGEIEYLEPSREQEARRAEALSHDMAARIRTALQARLEAPSMTAPWDARAATRLASETETAMDPAKGTVRGDSRDVQALRWRAPVTRTSLRLLAEIGPDELARRLADGRVDYSTAPTAMQIPMSSSEGILAKFLEDQTLFVDATNTFLAGRPPSGGHVEMSGIDRGVFGPGDPSRGVGKAIVRVSGGYRLPSLTADVTIADGGMISLASAWVSLSVEDRPLKKFAPKGDDSIIPVDRLAAEFSEASRIDRPASRSQMTMSVSTDEGASKELRLSTPVAIPEQKVGPALLGWILNPMANEPLNLSAGTLLAATAARRDENLVADLDDRCFQASLAQFVGRTSPSEWLSSRALQMDHEVQEDGGWITVNLRDPAGARKSRVNRSALADFLATLQRRRLMSLDMIGAYAQSRDSAMEDGDVDFSYMKIVSPGAALEGYDSAKWPMYRLFGALTSDQRDELARGGALSIVSLTQSASDALRRLVYDGNEQPRLVDQNGKGVDVYSKGIVLLWTQLLPGGLPSGTSVAAKVNVQPAAYCLNQVKNIAEIEPLTDIARDRFVRQSDRFREYAPPVDFDRFAPAQQRTFAFRFTFAPGLRLETELKDGQFDDSADLRTFAAMPSDFQDAINKEFAELKAAFGALHTGASSPVAPPPL